MVIITNGWRPSDQMPTGKGNGATPDPAHHGAIWRHMLRGQKFIAAPTIYKVLPFLREEVGRGAPLIVRRADRHKLSRHGLTQRSVGPREELDKEGNIPLHQPAITEVMTHQAV